MKTRYITLEAPHPSPPPQGVREFQALSGKVCQNKRTFMYYCAIFSIDIVNTLCYNVFMSDSTVKYYEIHSVNGFIFRFKLDLNPVNNKYEPHIWHRHQVEPEQVVSAFMNLTEEFWNLKHNRFEGYSETDDLNIFYNYYSKDKTRVMIITAFRI